MQSQCRIVDGIQHQLVGARFDAVELAVELVREFLQVGEIPDAGIPNIGRNRESVFGAYKIGSDFFDRSVFLVRLVVVHHCRVPIAQKDVEILALQARVDDVDPEKLALRLISQ
ncbi:hypothetical protein D3C87_1296770 [compost metagenome]